MKKIKMSKIELNKLIKNISSEILTKSDKAFKTLSQTTRNIKPILKNLSVFAGKSKDLIAMSTKKFFHFVKSKVKTSVYESKIMKELFVIGEYAIDNGLPINKNDKKVCNSINRINKFSEEINNLK